MPLPASNPSRLLTGPFFAPPDPPDTIVRLTEQRTAWIKEFKKEESLQKGVEIGDASWIQSLLAFLRSRDERINEYTLRKWVKRHAFILEKEPEGKDDFLDENNNSTVLSGKILKENRGRTKNKKALMK